MTRTEALNYAACAQLTAQGYHELVEASMVEGDHARAEWFQTQRRHWAIVAREWFETATQ